MSRVKSSVSHITDFSVTTTQTRKSDGSFTTSVKQAPTEFVTTSLIVPDITVNKEQADGYRAPSSYSMDSITKLDGLKMPTPGGGFTADASAYKIVETTSYTTVTEGVGVIAGRVPAKPVAIPYNLEQALRTKVRNNIQDEKVDVAMLLAEIGKTATTASGLLHRIGRSMGAIARRKPEHFSYLWHGNRYLDKRRPSDKFLRESAGIFLEWKYGIMPSVYDLEGLTQSLDDQAAGISLFDNPPLLVARANVQQSFKSTAQASFMFKNLAPVNLDTEIKLTGHARADFTVTGEGLRGLNQYGIGLTSVATVMYDTYPFSFVFNMAVPMAELIKAWGALQGVKSRGYTETWYQTQKTKPKTVVSRAGSLDHNLQIPSTEVVSFDRTGGSKVPMPLPYIRNPVSVGNISTALSLFTTLRKQSTLK